MQDIFKALKKSIEAHKGSRAECLRRVAVLYAATDLTESEYNSLNALIDEELPESEEE